MATIRKTITLTKQQDQWIKTQIQAGEFTNDSEYLRHLVRLDQAKNDKFQNLKAAIEEGLSSEISDKQIPELMEEVEKRMKSNGRL